MYSVVVVCGYGCHLVPELVHYLDKVCRFLKENETKPIVVLLCGGFTERKTAPGVSEARLMRDYIREQVPGLQIELEELSYTSEENIRGAISWIRYWAEVPEDNLEVVIWCEALRALKVRYFSWFHAPKMKFRIETDSWEPMPPLKQLVGTIYEILSLYIPGLRWYFHRKRIKLSEQR